MTLPVSRFESRQGQRIYRLPVEAFPGFWANSYLLLLDEVNILLDVGSGLGNSNELLEAGFEEVRQRFREIIAWDDLSHILISHGHIDHFGGLPMVQSNSQAQVGVHDLDLPVLINYETRLAVVEGRLRAYLVEAGLAREECQELMDMYLLNKSLFESVPVDFTFEATGMQLGPLEIIHTPGHCPGQVVFRLGEVLFSSDHVLPDVSPHQSPERLSLAAGLSHYLGSLDKIQLLSPEVSLILPGHGEAMHDLGGRIQAIKAVHQRRLSRVLELLQQPGTIAEVAKRLFPRAEGYHRLLALEETGAHVEFLLSRGFISLEPGGRVNDAAGPAYYQALENTPASLSAVLGLEIELSAPTEF